MTTERRPAPERSTPTVAPERPVATRDPVVEAPAGHLRWGPIVAGALTAFGTFLLLSMLAVAAGLGVVGPQTDADTATVLVAGIITLLAFALGGFVASWTAGLADWGRGFLSGFLVWTLWIVAVLVAAAFGVGQFFGAFGDMLGNIRAPDLDADEILDIIQTGAFQTFLALALTALAAALGGVLGAHDSVRDRVGRY